MSPFGLQPVGFEQTPTGSVEFFLMHVCSSEPPARIVPPQQSESFEQMSPTGLQPLAGWHTSTFVGPHGAHARLQQLPPQLGSPPSPTPASPRVPPHTMPSMSQPPLEGMLQRPNEFCPVFTQSPLQQSLFCAQMSPVCPQYEGCAQTEFWQKCEQHVVPSVHGLPSVEHPFVGSGVHVPLDPHVWLQQSELFVHAPLSFVHDAI